MDEKVVDHVGEDSYTASIRSVPAVGDREHRRTPCARRKRSRDQRCAPWWDRRTAQRDRVRPRQQRAGPSLLAASETCDASRRRWPASPSATSREPSLVTITPDVVASYADERRAGKRTNPALVLAIHTSCHCGEPSHRSDSGNLKRSSQGIRMVSCRNVIPSGTSRRAKNFLAEVSHATAGSVV